MGGLGAERFGALNVVLMVADDEALCGVDPQISIDPFQSLGMGFIVADFATSHDPGKSVSQGVALEHFLYGDSVTSGPNRERSTASGELLDSFGDSSDQGDPRFHFVPGKGDQALIRLFRLALGQKAVEQIALSSGSDDLQFAIREMEPERRNGVLECFEHEFARVYQCSVKVEDDCPSADHIAPGRRDSRSEGHLARGPLTRPELADFSVKSLQLGADAFQGFNRLQEAA